MSDKLQKIKEWRDNLKTRSIKASEVMPLFNEQGKYTAWLIEQLEQAQAENERLKKRLENCMESHTRLELGKQKLRAVYDENYAKAIERQLETERLQEENIRLTEANQKLVECLEGMYSLLCQAAAMNTSVDEANLANWIESTLSEVKGNG